MKLEKLPYALTVCKVMSLEGVHQEDDFYFIGKTDEELSLVCKTENTPLTTTSRDDGWRGFRVQGVLDFSQVGILSKLSAILAGHKISLFALSTYNTDYILVKEKNFQRTMSILEKAGYTIV